MTTSGSEIAAVLEEVRKARRSSAVRAWVHAGICLLGVIFTVGTYSAVEHKGGTYYVFWGAIVFGAINCVRHIIRYGSLGQKITELQAMTPRVAPAPRPPVPASDQLEPPLLRQSAAVAPVAPVASSQADPVPSAASHPALERTRELLSEARSADVPESEDNASIAWGKMIALLDEPAPSGPDAPNYSWDYIRAFLERSGNEVPPFKATRIENHTRLISISIASLAKLYYDPDYEPPISEESFDTEFSMMCTLSQSNGPEINGFLVRHDEGLGFFDMNDLFDEENNGTPILLPWPMVKHVYLGADPGIWPVIDQEKLGNVHLEAFSGRLRVAIQAIDGKALVVDVKPHVAFCDPVASRFVSTLEFLYRIGAEVPA